MSTKAVQVNFRMPETLKSALEDAARRGHRSLTAEIVARLESSLEQDATDPGALEHEHAARVDLTQSELEAFMERQRAALRAFLMRHRLPDHD